MSIFLIFNELVIFWLSLSFTLSHRISWNPTFKGGLKCALPTYTWVKYGHIQSNLPWCSWLHKVHDNGVFMAGKQEGKLLSFKAVEMMKPGDKDKSINDSEVSVKSVVIQPVRQPGRYLSKEAIRQASSWGANLLTDVGSVHYSGIHRYQDDVSCNLSAGVPQWYIRGTRNTGFGYRIWGSFSEPGLIPADTLLSLSSAEVGMWH